MNKKLLVAVASFTLLLSLNVGGPGNGPDDPEYPPVIDRAIVVPFDANDCIINEI